MDSEGSDPVAAAACLASAAAAVSAGSDDLPPVLFQIRFRRMETLPEQLVIASVATSSYPFKRRLPKIMWNETPFKRILIINHVAIQFQIIRVLCSKKTKSVFLSNTIGAFN